MSDGRTISEAEMDRRKRAAALRSDLSAFMAGHEERELSVWIHAVSGLLTRLSEWSIQEDDSASKGHPND